MAERSTGARRSDEEILAALDAAPDAFAVFYRRHVAALLRDFRERTSDAALAADLCAETFAAALAGAHRFDPSRGSATAWLFAIGERELAHAARTGAARDRARRRLGLATLDPPREPPAGSERPPDGGAAPVVGGAPPLDRGFFADLEDELVAAARFRAERRARRPALPRPSRAVLRGAIAGAAALALIAVVAALALRGGDNDTAAGDRSAAPLPASVRFRLLPMQPLAPCQEPARRPLDEAAAIDRIDLLSRPQRSADPLPFAPRMLPIGTFDPRSVRRATHTRLWSAVHVVPSADVAVGGECGSHVGPGLCLVADEQEFRCFTAVEVEWGRAVARTTADTLVGIVPDGVERVTVRGIGPPVGADVVDNVYEARMDVPAGLGIELEFGPRQGDGCRRTVAPDLLSEVALLRDRTQRTDRLPGAVHGALDDWPLDAVVADGARYWGRDRAVDFWAVPVVPRGRPQCAPASRVCVVAATRTNAAAQCVLGRNRRRENWWLGGVFPDRSLIFGTVPDGVTGVRVAHQSETAEVATHDNVFGGVLPFPFRVNDRYRVRLIRGEAPVRPLVGIVDAGGPVSDVVGRLQARGYQTVDAITPGVVDQPRSIVYWWPGRTSLEDALELAGAAGVEEVAPIVDTYRIPRPVLDTSAPFVIVVGGR